MRTVRVIHEEHPGYGWSFDSPDLDGEILCGGGATYDEAREMAEEAVRFALERDDVVVEHYVPEAARIVTAA